MSESTVHILERQLDIRYGSIFGAADNQVHPGGKLHDERVSLEERVCNSGVPPVKKFFCYVLEDIDDPARTYIGYSDDPHARLKKHNLGKGAKYTRGRRNRLALVVRGFPSKNLAMSFERAMKTVSRSVRGSGVEKKRKVIEKVMGGKWKYELPAGTLTVESLIKK